MKEDESQGIKKRGRPKMSESQKLKAKQKRDDRDNEESLPDKESDKKRKDEVTEKKKEP